jgi:alkyl sulfatase BDS1-like metallo-beta-lactamase superfamily hydrolase
VYQRYLGWYDGNPARLWARTPTDAGARYVKLAGGADALLAHAQAAYDEGDYRWVAEVVNHLVFSDPTNADARSLQANAFEQLGYQSESATWRNAYLTGAQELRNGTPKSGPPRRNGLAEALTVDMVFDAVAVRLKSEDVVGEHVLTNWDFTDIDQQWVLGLENQTLHYVAGRHDDDASVTVRMTKKLLADILGGVTTFIDAASAGDIELDGDAAALFTIFGNLDTFTTNFAIVEP